MKKVLAAICATAAMTACSTSRQTMTTESLNGEWNIMTINGKEVKTDNGNDAPFIGFNTAENLIYGSTGCNRLTGGLSADDAAKGTIDLSRMGSTRMMCPDMQTEQQVLGALGTVKTFSIGKDGTLKFADEGGTTVMELRKK